MNKTNLRKEYYSLFDRANKLVKKINPCEFDSKGICKRGRKHLKKGKKIEDVKFCCCGDPDGFFVKENACKNFISGKGCNTKSLMCKTWFCSEVIIPLTENKELCKIRKEAHEKGFMTFRGDFEDVLKKIR